MLLSGTKIWWYSGKLCLQLKYVLYFFQTGGKLSRWRKNFEPEKNKASLIRRFCMCYATDIAGFALVSWEAVEFRVYYYDFEQTFSCLIKIFKFQIILMEKLNFLPGPFGLQHAWRMLILINVC